MYGGKFNDTKQSVWKNVALMDKSLQIYGACCQKMTFCWFLLSTNDPIIGWKGYILQLIKSLLFGY